MAEHTKVPWDFDADDLGVWINSPEHPQPIAKMGKSGSLPAIANARHIVACVNFCEDYDDIEGSSIIGALGIAADEVICLAARNAELVEALGLLVTATGFASPSRRVGKLNLVEAVAVANAAITKAKGGA